MKNIFYGWYIVGTLIIVGIVASCVRYMLPVFVPSFIQDFNWTRTTIGFVFTLNFWIASAAGPFIGMMIDKVGGRFITTIGGIFLLSSMILLSTMTNITQLYIYFSLIAGLGIACTFYVPLTSIPRKWFIKRAGIAVSLVLMGAGSGLFIAPPIASILINNFGWRMSFIIFGIPLGILSIVVPATVIRNFPESIGLHPDGEIDCFQCASLNKDPSVQGTVTETGKQNYETKEIISTSSFWFLDLAYGLSHIVLMAIIPYMATWAQDFGIDRDSAAFALLLMGFFQSRQELWVGCYETDLEGRCRYVSVCLDLLL